MNSHGKTLPGLVCFERSLKVLLGPEKMAEICNSVDDKPARKAFEKLCNGFINCTIKNQRVRHT